MRWIEDDGDPEWERARAEEWHVEEPERDGAAGTGGEDEGFRLTRGGGELELDPEPARWALDPWGLPEAERWPWFEHIWARVCALRERYHLPVRTNWWADAVQLEALAALIAWVERYDSGEWDDPPGKLALLFEIERVGVLLRDGNDPFQPARDRPQFTRYLRKTGGGPAPQR